MQASLLRHGSEKEAWLRRAILSNDCKCVVICGTGGTGKTWTLERALSQISGKNVIVWNYGGEIPSVRKTKPGGTSESVYSSVIVALRLQHDHMADALMEEFGDSCRVAYFER